MDGGSALERFLLPQRAERLQQDVTRRCSSITVVLDGVHDPHNIGAVARSAEAFGLLHLHVVESNAPCRISPRVSQGAEKWLSVQTWPEPQSCLERLRTRGYQLWLADPEARDSLWDLPWPGPAALVFGNEHLGPSREMRQAAHGKFAIPLVGFSQSLNVSVAVGITLAAVMQWRATNLGGTGDLDPGQQQELLERWYRLSVHRADEVVAWLKQRSGGSSP